jgi:hypothetical protein
MLSQSKEGTEVGEESGSGQDENSMEGGLGIGERWAEGVAGQSRTGM